MAENLYNLVQQQMKSDSGKTKLGYTVTQYSGILGALEQSQYIIKKTVVEGGGGTAGTFNPSSGLRFGVQYSTYGQGKFTIKMESGTFWTDQKQGLCNVHSYMSFPIQNQDKTYHVPYEKHNDDFDAGNTLCGNFTFPPTKLEFTNNNSNPNDYVIGLGLDFQRFVLPYLEHFYGVESGWNTKHQTIRKIAQNKKLFAEVLFPFGGTSIDATTGGSGSFFVIHMPVVIDHDSGNDSFFEMYFPAPLLMLNSFNEGGKLGSVSVKLSDKNVTVGKDAIFPFASNHYNHKTGIISGFNQTAYKGLKLTDGGLQSTDISVSFPKGVNTQSFIRLFFDRSAQSDLGLSISDEKLKDQLFKSAYNTSELIKRLVQRESGGVSGGTILDTCRYEPNQVDWEWIKTSSWKPYYQYKNDIEKACKDNDLNVRLFLAHSAYETGYLKESKGWTAGLYNTGGILASKPNVTVNGAKYGLYNVTLKSSKIPSTGNDGNGGKSIHGYFIDFQTPYNGFFAHCHLVATSSNYGFKTFNLQTVSEYANALQNGVNGNPSYCANCPEYAETLIKLYKTIKGGNG